RSRRSSAFQVRRDVAYRVQVLHLRIARQLRGQRNGRSHLRRRRLLDDLHPEDVAHDVVLNGLLHPLELVEGLFLVDEQRVSLLIAAQMDALAQIVHVRQMLHPARIDRAQRHPALQFAHRPRALQRIHLLLARLVDVPHVIGQELDHLLARLALQVVDRQDGIEHEVVVKFAEQFVEFPFAGGNLGGRVDVDGILDVAADIVEDRLLQVHAFQDTAALLIDQFALPVHHVVVVEDVLARLEIVFLDLLLRPLDHAGEHLGVHRQMLLPGAQQGMVGPVAEQAPEFVFERDEEAALAGVALPPGASAQLVINAAALVPLRAEDEQAAQRTYLICGSLVFLVGQRACRHGVENARPAAAPPAEFFRFRLRAFFALAFSLLLLRLLYGILSLCQRLQAAIHRRQLLVDMLAAEQDVHAASGHVRRNRHLAFAPGLRDDNGLFLVELGVQDVMRDAVRQRLFQIFQAAIGDLEDTGDLVHVLRRERIVFEAQFFQDRAQLDNAQAVQLGVDERRPLALLLRSDGFVRLDMAAHQLDHAERGKAGRSHPRADPLAHLDGARADEQRLLLAVDTQYLRRDAPQLMLFRLIDDIRMVYADDRPVRRNLHYVERVDFAELFLFRLGGSGHAAQFGVQPELVLEGDGGECLALVLDLDMLFGFDGLMQPIRIAATEHQAARILVHDDDFRPL